MRIAVASGKGGTGKTTVSVNLAVVAGDKYGSAALLDCDVEEPNAHLFLERKQVETRPVTTPVPEVDAQRCIGCGQCAAICRFSAIVLMADKVLVYPELCHACGGCSRVCPVKALQEIPQKRGEIRSGRSGRVTLVDGVLAIGEPMSPPVIKAVKKTAVAGEIVLLDAPPGTSCAAVESVRDADFVLLVTEPTPFGLHDLKLAVAMLRQLGLPCGVVINRCDAGDNTVREYCQREGITVLAGIPNDRRIAEIYSRGGILVRAAEEFAGMFEELWHRIESVIRNGRLMGKV